MPILRAVETPEIFLEPDDQPPARERPRTAPGSIWASGERVTWLAGLILALGALATVFVLIRLISIPDSVIPADGRGIGIWISLLAALGVIAGGLLRAAEEL